MNHAFLGLHPSFTRRALVSRVLVRENKLGLTPARLLA
jgi:hypothetical protein